MGASPPPPPPPAPSAAPGRDGRPADADPRQTLEIVKDLLTGVQSLVRQEVELARQETVELIRSRVTALAAVAVAGLVGLYALGFAASAGAHALDLVLPEWASRLIVAGVFVVIAVIALVIARTQSKIQTPPLERTKSTTKENVAWAKQQLRR